jgi:hypothetical protein
MIKLKLTNPVGDIVKDIELSEWTDIESFESSHRFILESSDGSIFNYSEKEWMELPTDYQSHPKIKAPLSN